MPTMGRRTFRTEDNGCEFKVLMLNKFGLFEEQKAQRHEAPCGGQEFKVGQLSKSLIVLDFLFQLSFVLFVFFNQLILQRMTWRRTEMEQAEARE